MANVEFYRFVRPFRTAGGATVPGVRVFSPPNDFSFTPRFAPEDIGGAGVTQFVDTLHPDIRAATVEALATLKRSNIAVTLQSAGNGDTLAHDRLAFRIIPQDPAKAQDVAQAMANAGFVAGRGQHRYQSNTDAEAAAIAAMPSVPNKSGQTTYRVIPGGTVWNDRAGILPPFASDIQRSISAQFGNQNTPGRRLALDNLPATPATPQPVAAPVQATPAPSAPLIVLDPGHGRYISKNPKTGELVNTSQNPNGLINDKGAEHGGLTEVQLNDAMTARVALSMRDRNYTVQLTRRIDTANPMLNDLSAADKAYLGTLNARSPEVLPDRFNSRIETGAGEKALHLSIHANSGASTKRGAEFYIHSDHASGGPSAQWAQTLRDQFKTGGMLNERPDTTQLNTGIIAPQAYDGVASQIREGTGSPDRHVVRGLGHNIGGVVAELGYMSNPQDMARMRDPAQQKTAAELIANATDTFQQARAQGKEIKVQPVTPSSFSIRDDITQPHVRQATEQLSQWHKALPQERQNPRFNLQDPNFLNSPDNRQSLLLHFKQDQNQHASGSFAVTDAAQQPMVGLKVSAALKNAGQPQTASTPQVPSSFSIRDDIAQPHVRQATEQLSQWHKALPQARQNPGFNLQDPNFLNSPDNRQSLLLHFKQDQNQHANGSFAVGDPATQPMVGPKVTTALQNAAAPQPTPATPAVQPVPVPAAVPARPSTPDPSGLLPRPSGRTTPEQRGDRHTENGLRVLGITREGMSEQDRSTALRTYAQGAGLPENASAAEMGVQVRKDITTLQTHMRDASQAGTTRGQYDLGNFGPARDGVDGIAGAYTQGAAKQFAQAQGAATVMALVREPAPATATGTATPEQRDAQRAEDAARNNTPAGQYLADRARERASTPTSGNTPKPAQKQAPDFPALKEQVAAATRTLTDPSGANKPSGGENKQIDELEAPNHLPKKTAAVEDRRASLRG